MTGDLTLSKGPLVLTRVTRLASDQEPPIIFDEYVTPVSDIGQIALIVRDVAKARHFYGDVLGLKFLFEAGPNLAFLSAGSVRIMLTTSQGVSGAGKNSILYFRTASVDSAYAWLIERGAQAEPAPQLTAKMPDHELWMAFIRDPDGNLVGLMEERR